MGAILDVRRQLSQTRGSYIFGKIQDMDVAYTLVQRACETIILSSFWIIAEPEQPKLIDVGKQAKGASGEPQCIWGRATLT